MTDQPRTIDGNTSFVSKEDYARVFVLCKNCRSRHHQYFLKGVCVNSCECTKCGCIAIEPSTKSYEQHRHEMKEERRKRGEKVYDWEF